MMGVDPSQPVLVIYMDASIELWGAHAHTILFMGFDPNKSRTFIFDVLELN
jgi:hypothetical protein